MVKHPFPCQYDTSILVTNIDADFCTCPKTEMRQIHQDLVAMDEGILFHQVNCDGIMGGGIARAFADKYPDLEPAYRRFIEETGRDNVLGQTFFYRVHDELFIANVFGQDSVSSFERATDYEAVASALEQARSKLNDVPYFHTYFPYTMGCGLGGGEWSIYKAILFHYFPNGTICKLEN